MLCSDGNGTDRRIASILQTGMRNAADVPELNEDFAIALVNCSRRFFPAFHLLVVINARRKKIALTLNGDLRAFGNNQPGGCTLLVIRRLYLELGSG